MYSSLTKRQSPTHLHKVELNLWTERISFMLYAVQLNSIILYVENLYNTSS